MEINQHAQWVREGSRREIFRILRSVRAKAQNTEAQIQVYNLECLHVREREETELPVARSMKHEPPDVRVMSSGPTLGAELP